MRDLYHCPPQFLPDEVTMDIHWEFLISQNKGRSKKQDQNNRIENLKKKLK